MSTTAKLDVVRGHIRTLGELHNHVLRNRKKELLVERALQDSDTPLLRYRQQYVPRDNNYTVNTTAPAKQAGTLTFASKTKVMWWDAKTSCNELIDPLIKSLANSTPAREKYRCHDERERSFAGVRLPGGGATAVEFARWGWYYSGVDTVACVFCAGEAKLNKTMMRPREVHVRMFPTCPLLLGLNCNNVPAKVVYPRSLKTAVPAKGNFTHPEYSDEASRLATFVEWPEQQLGGVSGKDMAACGFFSTDQSVPCSNCDPLDYTAVECYACDLTVPKWQYGDDPWIVHAVRSPRCRVVKVFRGGEENDDSTTGTTAVAVAAAPSISSAHHQPWWHADNSDEEMPRLSSNTKYKSDSRRKLRAMMDGNRFRQAMTLGHHPIVLKFVCTDYFLETGCEPEINVLVDRAMNLEKTLSCVRLSELDEYVKSVTNMPLTSGAVAENFTKMLEGK